ncbi:GNAT family N-acetyltransferase [Microbulbifer spongiae]|uniref:GNAT family N-acetyltransferase n=1 Tax=Microbulbifer spongiae TaxID=2944933 RepID=A0ABY9E6B4_9GAMM|nr:GNAT family N-acetyltransferase [Microbulbifer sp. MI-G]WKD48579.1 GNAT family N-acetyltransferase [Microbulbifer sp. MI-G]
MEVAVRAAEIRDYKRISEIFDHPYVVAQSSQHPYLGIDKVSTLFQERTENAVVLVAEVGGRVQGYIGIDLCTKPRSKHVASLGMAVHPEIHGKGVGSCLLREAIELADQWLNIIRLELSVYTDNTHGISLYKKFGFEIEGESRFASFKAGHYIGLYQMARIHPGFNQEKGNL